MISHGLHHTYAQWTRENLMNKSFHSNRKQPKIKSYPEKYDRFKTTYTVRKTIGGYYIETLSMRMCVKNGKLNFSCAFHEPLGETSAKVKYN